MRSYIYSIVSVPIFALLYFFTALIVFILLIFAQFNWERAVRAGINFWARTVFIMIGKRLRINGLENFDKKKKYILIANHASLFDIMAIMAIQPGVSWFGHVRLTKIPVFRKLLRMINYIPVNKGSIRNTKEMIQQMVEKSQGLTIAIFPEGADGNCKPFWQAYHMKRWKTGFVRLALQRGAKVVPVAIIGGEEALPVAATLENLKPLLGSVAPLPLSLMPMPSYWRIYFMQPIDFAAFPQATAEDPEACMQLAHEVGLLVQDRLENKAWKNPLLWLSDWVDKENDNPNLSKT